MVSHLKRVSIGQQGMNNPYAARTEKTQVVRGISDVPTAHIPSVVPPYKQFERLDTIINSLKRENLERPDRWGQSKEMKTINAMRAALIELATLNASPDVVVRVQELLTLSVDVLGV